MLNKFCHSVKQAALRAPRNLFLNRKRTLLCIVSFALLLTAATLGSAMSKRVIVPKKVTPTYQATCPKAATADTSGFPHLYSFPSWFLGKCFRLLHLS